VQYVINQSTSKHSKYRQCWFY